MPIGGHPYCSFQTLSVTLLLQPQLGPMDISFLLLMEQIATHIETQNNINVLFYSSGAQEFEMGLRKLKSRCWQDGVLSGGSR